MLLFSYEKIDLLIVAAIFHTTISLTKIHPQIVSRASCKIAFTHLLVSICFVIFNINVTSPIILSGIYLQAQSPVHRKFVTFLLFTYSI